MKQTTVKTTFTLNEKLNVGLIKYFYHCLFPFVSVVDEKLIKNKKVYFRKSIKDKNFDIEGIIYSQNLNNRKYLVKTKLDDFIR